MIDLCVYESENTFARFCCCYSQGENSLRFVSLPTKTATASATSEKHVQTSRDLNPTETKVWKQTNSINITN